MITLILVATVALCMLYAMVYMRRYDDSATVPTCTQHTVDDTMLQPFIQAVAQHAYFQCMLYTRHKGDKETWVAWWISMHYAALVDAYDDAVDASDAVHHTRIAQQLLNSKEVA